MKKRNPNLILKAAIIEQGQKMEDVAKAIDMAHTTFSRKINGHALFDEVEIMQICKYLDKSPMDIFFNDVVTKRITA